MPKKKKKAAPKKKTTTKKRVARKQAVAPKKKTMKAPARKAPAAVDVDARAWTAGAHAEELGEMDVTSGKVMVCDPGTLFAPVSVTVPNGTYEVRVGRDGGDNFASALVAKGASPKSWKKVGTYAVDAGMSGFFDSGVLARVDEHPWETSIYDDLICNHLDVAEGKGHAGAFCPFEGARFSSCRSGYGDGVYPVFAGTDEKGKVVAVVTTFM